MSKKPAAAGAGAAVTLLKILVPAGKATPSPPIGPALGQRGVKSMDFCKQFNDRTKDMVADTPIPTVISIKPDRSFTFVIKTPPTTYMLKKAARVEKGAAKAGTEVVGKLSLKYVYEIAKVKQQDESLKHLELRKIAGSVVGVARSVGIQIVP